MRPDGVRIVTVVDGNGRLIRRYRRDRDGREHNIIDNRRFYRNLGVGIGIGVLGGIVYLNLPPPRVTIPYDRYIVDYDSASDDDLDEALDSPPVEMLERAYSLEEIRDNYELRARLRRIDLDTINFEFGSWEIGPDQEFKLERIARAMLRVLERNPEAVFLIEGHTDAVGSDGRQPQSLRPARPGRCGSVVGKLRRAGREPRHPGLRRAVPQDRHAGTGAAQPPCDDPQHQPG